MDFRGTKKEEIKESKKTKKETNQEAIVLFRVRDDDGSV